MAEQQVYPDTWQQAQAPRLAPRAADFKPSPAPAPNLAKRVSFKRLADFAPLGVDWLIEDWMAKGALTLLAGPAGIGKSAIAASIASAVTAKGKLHGSDLWQRPVAKGSVVLYDSESMVHHTLVPTWQANGVDLGSVAIVQRTAVATQPDRDFDLATDVAALADALPQDAALLVLDPVMDIAGLAKDSYNAAEMRRRLKPLVELAQERHVAVLGVTHFLKRARTQGGSVLDRVLGSAAWSQVARTVLVADWQGEQRTLAIAKSNIAPSDIACAFDLEREVLGKDAKGKAIVGVKVVWQEPIEATAEQLFGDADKRQSAVAQAEAWLRTYFENTPDSDPVCASRQDLVVQGRQAGLSANAVTKALTKLGREKVLKLVSKGRGGGSLWIGTPPLTTQQPNNLTT